MSEPASGLRIHHDPDGNTANYDGVTSGNVLTITYVNKFEDDAHTVVREYDAAGSYWDRGLNWRRIYTPGPPATYVVREYCDGQWVTRETGTYTTEPA